MTTYYIVKVVTKAKPNHPNTPGVENTYYYGKGETMIGYNCKDNSFSSLDVWDYTEWQVKEYGYRRLCDAKRAVKAHDRTEKYWDVTVTIIAETIA